LTKTPLIYSVSRFSFGGLEPCLGRLSPPKPPRGDGIALVAIEEVLGNLHICGSLTAIICKTVTFS